MKILLITVLTLFISCESITKKTENENIYTSNRSDITLKILTFKKYYPQVAKDNNVTSRVLTEIIIDEKGNVINVDIVNVEIYAQYAINVNEEKEYIEAFTISSRKTLYSAKFEPIVINGKNIKAKVEFPINYELK